MSQPEYELTDLSFKVVLTVRDDIDESDLIEKLSRAVYRGLESDIVDSEDAVRVEAFIEGVE